LIFSGNFSGLPVLTYLSVRIFLYILLLAAMANPLCCCDALLKGEADVAMGDPLLLRGFD